MVKNELRIIALVLWLLSGSFHVIVKVPQEENNQRIPRTRICYKQRCHRYFKY